MRLAGRLAGLSALISRWGPGMQSLNERERASAWQDLRESARGQWVPGPRDSETPRLDPDPLTWILCPMLILTMEEQVKPSFPPGLENLVGPGGLQVLGQWPMVQRQSPAGRQ